MFAPARYGITVGIPASMLVFFACSSSESLAPIQVQEDSGDGGTSIAQTDAEAVSDASDASSDGGVNADADAGPRTCSDQGFCRTELPSAQVLRGVWGDGQGTAWTVSDSGNILRWDGVKWNVHAANPAERYFAVWGSSPTDVWIGGSQGLLHGIGATAATLVFAPVTSPWDTTIPINAIWGTGPDDVWAVGGSLSSTFPYSSRGHAMHLAAGVWTDAGPAATNISFVQVWGTPGSGIWIGGSSVTSSGLPGVGLFRLAPGADDFETVALPAVPVGAAFANPSRVDVGVATSDTTVVVLGTGRTAGASRKTVPAVWRGSSDDQGATFSWTLDPGPNLPDTVPLVSFQQTAAFAVSPNDIWATGIYGRLRHWNGTEWSAAALTVTSLPETASLYGIWGKSSNDFWVVGDNLAIHQSTRTSP